jgi:ketosteroid isomerase-like protein
MGHEKLIRDYLRSLESGDCEKVLSLFEDDAIINSPLYGKQKAKLFYAELFRDTNQSRITLLNTFDSNENDNTCCGHFKYDWTMKDGSLVTFECVDIFKISIDEKIEELRIIYDTFGVRNEFNNLK